MKWLSDLAPTIFNALTGNIPGAAISAAAFIAKQLGWSNSNPGAVMQQLTTLTPEQQLQFADLELHFKKLSNDELDLYLADTQDARDTQVKLAADGIKDPIRSILSYLIFGAFLVMILALFIVPMPASNKEILAVLIGLLGGEFKQSFNYWFGTTKGSADKSDFIQSQINNNKQG